MSHPGRHRNGLRNLAGDRRYLGSGCSIYQLQDVWR
jgi:hypothetical protein